MRVGRCQRPMKGCAEEALCLALALLVSVAVLRLSEVLGRGLFDACTQGNQVMLEMRLRHLLDSMEPGTCVYLPRCLHVNVTVLPSQYVVREGRICRLRLGE